MVQWLELQALTAGDIGSIPDQRTKIPHVMWLGPNFKKIIIINFKTPKIYFLTVLEFRILK